MQKNNNISSFEEEKEKRRKRAAKKSFFDLLNHVDKCASFYSGLADYAFVSPPNDGFPFCMINASKMKKEKNGRSYKEYTVKVYE